MRKVKRYLRLWAPVILGILAGCNEALEWLDVIPVGTIPREVKVSIALVVLAGKIFGESLKKLEDEK